MKKEETVAASDNLNGHRNKSDNSNSNTEQSEDKPDNVDAQTEELTDDLDLFHGPDSETAYASTSVQGRIETWLIQSRSFELFLSKRWYKAHGKPPQPQKRKACLELLEARAIHEGPQREVYVRIAHYEGRIYLDLADDERRCVVVSVERWEVILDPPVRFLRPKGIQPLPLPVGGGDLVEILSFLNIGGGGGGSGGYFTDLVIGWLIAALSSGPYPMLVLHGSEGSAKSTATRLLKSVLDPHSVPIKGPPKDEHDLVISARNNHILAYDNISRIKQGLSDGLCRLLTGSGFATRRLYTDFEEAAIHVKRPVIVNGIDEFLARSDLLSRSYVVYLDKISPEDVQEEAVVDQRFQDAHPRILGALLDAASAGLRNYASTELPRLPRLADATRFVCGAAETLGWGPERFIEACEQNTASANEMALESSAVGPFIVELFEQTSRNEFVGTSKELLAELNLFFSDYHPNERKPTGWPETAKMMSNAVRRVANALESAGLHVILPDPRHKTTHGRREITITQVSDSTATTATTATSGDRDDWEEVV